MKGLKAYIWPAVEDGDHLRAAQLRIIGVIALTVVVCGGLAGALNFVANYERFPPQAWIGLVTPLTLGALPALARSRLSLRTTGLLTVSFLYVVLTGQAASMGGMAYPVVIYLPGLPILAAFLVGPRAGLGFGVLVGASMGGLFLFRDWVPTPADWDINYYLLGWITITLILLTLAASAVCAIFAHQMAAAGAALEEARKRSDAANQAKTAFLTNISHEIRTPMNAMLGMAQALQQDALGPDQRDKLEMMTRSGDALLRLVNEVLDMARIEAGRLEIVPQNFRLTDTVAMLEGLFAAQALEKGLDFSIRLTGDGERVFVGDPVRIGQILANLTANAIKFTQAGHVQVSLHAHAPDDEGQARITMRVADSGIGIAPEDAKGLFRPFAQAGSAEMRAYGGTGLGLAICRQLCELMDGEISLQSTPGQGSTFTASIAVRAAAPDLVMARPEPQQRDLSALQRLRVLAADDSQTNRLVLRALLDSLVGTLCLVENGQEALDLLDAESFDIVLLDSRMPVMDGLSATREIRRREAGSGQPSLPVYALTANVMPEQVAEYEAAGMDGVLAKPISRDALISTLMSHALHVPEDRDDRPARYLAE
ncbi:ATP-binding protein [Maricaulis parjimensis]|uniref:ATP-binding protein n=1 Tax=Maricaulis parjimensis TaxID=144023 RepID=UPI001EEE4A90|nr:ATP-binding protein [Maricaulis parjimensis]